MFGHPAVRAADPDYLPLSIGLAAFGGHAMSATLMDEVRRKRGLAYGAYLTLEERRGTGAAAGWVFSGTDKTVATLKLVLKLYVSFMEKGLDAQQVAFFQRFLAGSHAAEMDAPEHRLAARVSDEISGRPPDYLETLRGAGGRGHPRRGERRHQAARPRPRPGHHDGRDRRVDAEAAAGRQGARERDRRRALRRLLKAALSRSSGADRRAMLTCRS